MESKGIYFICCNVKFKKLVFVSDSAQSFWSLMIEIGYLSCCICLTKIYYNAHG